MTIKKAILKGSKSLQEHNIDKYGSAHKQARILLAHCLGVDLLYLITNDTKKLDSKAKENYFFLIDKACKNEPIEYLINKVSFYSKDFFVNKNVLIPRAETELLIDNLLLNIKDKNDFLSLAEIGVGSGVISIILSTKLKNSNFIATDISCDAISVAKKNAILHKIENINFIQTSLLENIDKKIDIIISNPPYIKNNTKLEENISFEPDIALFGGEDGDEILKQIIDIAYTKNVKILCCEIGYNQKEDLSKYIQKKYTYKKLSFYKDLSGFDRGFILIIRD